MTIPPQVEQVLTKIDAFMAKYPQVTQYGKFCIHSTEWHLDRSPASLSAYNTRMSRQQQGQIWFDILGSPT